MVSFIALFWRIWVCVGSNFAANCKGSEQSKGSSWPPKRLWGGCGGAWCGCVDKAVWLVSVPEQNRSAKKETRLALILPIFGRPLIQ